MVGNVAAFLNRELLSLLTGVTTLARLEPDVTVEEFLTV